LRRRRDGVWLEKGPLDPGIHMLQKPPAWATDVEHIALLRRLGGFGVRIASTDGRTWEASLRQFERHGFEVRRGHGRQLALPLRFWGVLTAGQPSFWDVA
jgi:hypothetical protein